MTAKIIWRRGKAAFRYPLGAAPRTAILLDWFDVPKPFPLKSIASLKITSSLVAQNSASQSSVRIFRDGWSDEVQAFAPEAMVGTGAQLLALAEAQSQNDPLVTLKHAVISVARLGEPLLTKAQRDQLWLAFQVPLFEQVVGPRGVLLAAECEAHNGLHDQTRTGATAGASEMAWRGFTIDEAPCACGQSSPRLKVKPTPVKTRAAGAR